MKRIALIALAFVFPTAPRNPAAAQTASTTMARNFNQQTIKTAGHTDPPTNPIVIVHGAWGGRHHWKETAQFLSDHWKGPVYRAGLTGLGDRVHLASPKVNLQTHITDVVNLIEFEGLQNVILVGHSYGGIVVSGVADVAGDRLDHLVYLDASLLDNGESFLTHDPNRAVKLIKGAKESGEGWAVPVDWKNPMRDVPHPLATLTDKLVLKNEASKKNISAAYWLFTDDGPLEKDSRKFYFHRAVKRGYDVKDFPWGHNPQRSSPKEIGQQLLELFHNKTTAKRSPTAPSRLGSSRTFVAPG